MSSDKAIVALESALITHGLPKPLNLEVARELEAIVLEGGAVPATIGVLSGQIVVGLNDSQLSNLASSNAEKASLWNLSALLTKKQNAGTTVATTCQIASLVGIKVFSTGGIGGVHKNPFDESADLIALSRYPVLVVCAGFKSILNISATRERLESLGIPLIGYRTEKLAGFYLSETDHYVPVQLDSSKEIAECFQRQQELNSSALLVAKPVSQGLDYIDLEVWLNQTQEEINRQNIIGNEVTPNLLARLTELSKGSTLEVNTRLLKENVKLATEIAINLKSIAKHS